MPDQRMLPTRERLLIAGAAVFAEKGYAGGSTREICKKADTSINMVHHCFGSKAALLDAIIAQYGEQVLALPLRLIAAPAKSTDDLTARLELLFDATTEACLEHRDLMKVVMREGATPAALVEYSDTFTAFLESGKRDGLVRSDLDASMVTGAILDRIINQVLYMPGLNSAYGVDVSDPEYRSRWVASNIDFFLHGILPAP